MHYEAVAGTIYSSRTERVVHSFGDNPKGHAAAKAVAQRMNERERTRIEFAKIMRSNEGVL